MILITGCDGGGSDAPAPQSVGPNDTEVDGGDAEVDGGDAEVPVSNGGCTGELELCDIRDEDCQRSIAEEVGCLRGREPVMPPVRLLTEDEYVDLLGEFGDPVVDPRLKQWLNGLALFDLARTGTTSEDRNEDHAELIAASYNQLSKEVVVIDRGMPLDDVGTVVTLAHELVHAQQDAEHDLVTWSSEHSVTDDAAIASRCIVEGEAVLFHVQVWNALTSWPFEDSDWDELYERDQLQALAAFDASESAYETVFAAAPYAFGGQLVTDAWRSGGQDGIDALFDAPPSSMREVLFGDAEGMAEAEETLSVAALPAVPGFAPVSFQTFGAFMFRTFLKRHGASDETALRVAETLGADVFAVSVGDDGTAVSTWRLQMLEGSDFEWLTELDLGPGFTLVFDAANSSQITFVAGPPEVLDLAPLFRWDPLP